EKHHLVDIEGRPLIGTKKNEPLTLTDGPIEIAPNGDVKQNGSLVDHLKMEVAPKGVELTREGEALWVPPQTRQPQPAQTRNVKRGGREESNVNSMGALVDMAAVQRAYAWVQKAVIERDQTNKTPPTQPAKPL